MQHELEDFQFRMTKKKVTELVSYTNKVKNEGAIPLAKAFIQLRRLYDELNEAKKKLGKLVDHIKLVDLPEAFEEAGLGSSITLDEGYRVTISQLTRASCNKEHKYDAYQWLKDNGFDEIVTETVNAGTLSSLAKSLLEGSNPDASIFELPEELFNVHIQPTTSVTKVQTNGVIKYV